MIEFIPIIIKSSICLAVFYLLFRYTLKKETFFTLNRILLISLVILSIAIPFLYFPWPVNTEMQVNLFPIQPPFLISEHNDIAIEIFTSPIENRTKTTATSNYSEKALLITYIMGFIISLMILLFNVGKIIYWISKSKIFKREGYKLALVHKNVSPMSFGNFIIMSRYDYRENRLEILKHELTHIKYRHTYDLLLLELVKIVHWFNPLVYALIRDLKELQEFQVDRKVIQSGIDSKAYQLLMIKKSVGTGRYSLANSFNHCQIKKRIAMMNKSNSRKTNLWKVAIFLPVIILMFTTNCKTKTNSSAKFSSEELVSMNSNLDIEGAWRYVISQKTVNGKTYTLAKEGTKYKEMKIWSKDHFAFVGNQGIGEHPFGGNGRYKLNGNYYEEIAMVAPLKNGNEEEIFKMKLEISNDTLYQIWPSDTLCNYDKNNFNIIKMVRME